MKKGTVLVVLIICTYCFNMNKGFAADCTTALGTSLKLYGVTSITLLDKPVIDALCSLSSTLPNDKLAEIVEEVLKESRAKSMLESNAQKKFLDKLKPYVLKAAEKAAFEVAANNALKGTTSKAMVRTTENIAIKAADRAALSAVSRFLTGRGLGTLIFLGLVIGPALNAAMAADAAITAVTLPVNYLVEREAAIKEEQDAKGRKGNERWEDHLAIKKQREENSKINEPLNVPSMERDIETTFYQELLNPKLNLPTQPGGNLNH